MLIIISWFIIFYCKLQLYFAYHLHCTPFTCGKGPLNFLHIENSNVLTKNSNYTFLEE
jgi:hypothetical protein